MAFAHLLIDQQRGAIGEAGGHAGAARRGDANRLVKFHIIPAVVLENGGVRRVQRGGRLETLPFSTGITRSLDAAVGNRDAGAVDGVTAEGDENRTAAANVLAEFILE